MADTPKQFAKRLERMGLSLSEELGRAAELGAATITARAKRKLTEKGHVVTGALRRDVNEQLIVATQTVAVVAIGVALTYGKYVEALPDGGYLFEATEEGAAQSVRVTAKALEAALRKGAR